MYAQWFGHNEVSKIRAPHGIGLFQVICSYPSSLSLDQLSGNEPKTFKPYFSVWPKATVRGFNVSVLIRKEHPKGSASANRSKFTGMKIKYGYASWNANNKSQTDGSFWCHPQSLINRWMGTWVMPIGGSGIESYPLCYLTMASVIESGVTGVRKTYAKRALLASLS